MSFSYNTTLSAERDALRFYIHDTVNTAKSPAIFEDEELTGLLNREGNLFRAAALALRSRAASFVDKAFSYSVGPGARGAFSADRRGILKDIMALAAGFEARALATPDEAFDRIDFNIGADGVDRSNYQGFSTDLDQL